MSSALTLLASLSLLASPDLSGVFRGGKSLIAITATGKEGAYTVQQYAAPGDGQSGRVEKTAPRTLSIGETQVLEFSPDFKRFTVTVSSELFGPLRGQEIFVRLGTAELEKLSRTRELDAGQEEAKALLKALYAAARKHFAEKAEYPTELTGIALDGCPDGTHAPASESELAGCRFTARILVRGVGPQGVFTATALGVEAPVKGLKLSISSAPRGLTPAGVVRVEK